MNDTNPTSTVAEALPPRLSADDAIACIQRQQKMHGSREWRLTVAISNPGGLTAHQTVEVEAIEAGFDWTAGQLILRPAVPLSMLTAEQVADVTKSVRAGGSWHAYEREKKVRAELAALQAENARLVRERDDARDFAAHCKTRENLWATAAREQKLEADALKASKPADVEALTQALNIATEALDHYQHGGSEYRKIAAAALESIHTLKASKPDIESLLALADGMVMHHDTSDCETYREALRTALGEPDLIRNAVRAMLAARDNFGWSSEVDDEINKLRALAGIGSGEGS